MGTAKVYLTVILASALPAYFLGGPLIALGSVLLGLLIVLIWDNAAPGLVLSTLKASRMTDASVSSNMIHRLFLGDVKALCGAAGVNSVQMYIVDTHVPLAFSLGTAKGVPQIVVTAGLFRTLTRLEVSAVIGHELGHLRAGDSALNAMRLSVGVVLSKLRINALFRTFGHVLPQVNALSRIMLRPDTRADAFSADLCKDGRILASALKKLERGVRAVQWSALDQLPFLAKVSVVDPFAAQFSDAQPQNSKTAYRMAELSRIEPKQAA